MKKLFRNGFLLLMIMAIALTSGCSWSGKKKSPSVVPGNSITPAPSKNTSELYKAVGDGINITGILNSIDSDKKKLHFIDVTTGNDYEISYSDGTVIKNAYGASLFVSLMKLGQIYDINCSKTGLANSIVGSKNAWERNDVSGVLIDESTRKVTIGGSELGYEPFSIVTSGDAKLSIAKVLQQDVVTLRGIGDKVYSISVNKGHGYLSFTGTDAFVGGYVSVGKKELYGVTGNMILTVAEGDFTVEIQNGTQRASKNVTINKDMQSVLDFSEYTQPATKTGQVKFSITPSNATLTIDNVEVDYSRPIELTYGKHIIKVETNYYNSYSETLYVSQSYQTKYIDLEAKSSTTAAGGTTVKPSTTSSTTAAATTAASNTNGYKVTVSTPVGASLYVDGSYVGMIPCSFDKTQGNKTITLSQNGYTTVSYTIAIANAAGDLTYSFPDMVSSGNN